MTTIQLRKFVGLQFLVGVVLLNIPYALLVHYFQYPEVLRLPTGVILTRFAQGGPGLIWIWLAFCWVGLPILFGMILLPRALDTRTHPLLQVATTFGVTGGVLQMLGLLRWTFVVPAIARTYIDPAATATMREVSVVVFQAVHQYGGVVMGEHLGQIFTILWISLTSISVIRTRLLPQWFGWSGIAVSGIYILAQSELLATVVSFPVVPAAGLVGSLLWLGWMIALGVNLMRAQEIRVSLTPQTE